MQEAKTEIQYYKLVQYLNTYDMPQQLMLSQINNWIPTGKTLKEDSRQN